MVRFNHSSWTKILFSFKGAEMKCFVLSRTKQGSSVPAASSDTVTAEYSIPAGCQLPPHYLECPLCCYIHISVSHLALLICLKHLQYFQLLYLLGPPSSAWANQHSLWECTIFFHSPFSSSPHGSC